MRKLSIENAEIHGIMRPDLGGRGQTSPTAATPPRPGLVSAAPLRPHDPALRCGARTATVCVPRTDSRTHRSCRTSLRRALVFPSALDVPTMRGSSGVRRRRSVPAGGRRGCSCWITSWPSEALPTRAGAAVAFRPCRSAPFGCTRNSPTSGCRARSGPCGSGQAASPPTLHDSQLVL